MDIKTAERAVIESMVPHSGVAVFVISLIAIIFLIITTILYFALGGYLLTSSDFPPVLGWQPDSSGELILGIGGAVVSFIVLLGVTIIYFQKRKMQKIKKLLNNGVLKEAVVRSNIQNFYITQNDVPQRVIIFESEGQQYEYRFFSEEWAAHFITGAVFKIRCDLNKNKAVPDAAFLTSLFS